MQWTKWLTYGTEEQYSPVEYHIHQMSTSNIYWQPHLSDSRQLRAMQDTYFEPPECPCGLFVEEGCGDGSSQSQPFKGSPVLVDGQWTVSKPDEIYLFSRGVHWESPADQ